MKRIQLLLLSFSLLQSCSNDICYNDTGPKVYYSKNGSSFNAPKMGPGLRVDEIVDNDYTYVSFIDDFGGLTRVETLVLNEDEYSIENDKKRSKLSPASFFEHVVFKPIIEQVPTTELLEYSSAIMEEIGPYFYAVLKIPEGSTMQCLETGKRLDSYRAYLVSFHEDHAIIISSQESLIMQRIEEITDKVTGKTSEKNFKNLLDEILAIRLSYDINQV